LPITVKASFGDGTDPQGLRSTDKIFATLFNNHRNKLLTRWGTARAQEKSFLLSDSAYRPANRRNSADESGTAQTQRAYVLRTTIFNSEEEKEDLHFFKGG
jgi:hypothetical protein